MTEAVALRSRSSRQDVTLSPDKKAAAAAAGSAQKTFGDYAINDWLPVCRHGLQEPPGAKELKRVLEVNAAPLFSLALDAISKPEVLSVLTPIWTTKAKDCAGVAGPARKPPHRQRSPTT